MRGVNNHRTPPLLATAGFIVYTEGKEKLLGTASDMSQLDRYKKRSETDVAQEA